MAIKYVRCAECCCIYNADQDECPRCGSKDVINESSGDSEAVFNIFD